MKCLLCVNTVGAASVVFWGGMWLTPSLETHKSIVINGLTQRNQINSRKLPNSAHKRLSSLEW